MVLWWIGNAVLFFVVLPVVIFLMNRILAAVERIRAASDDILTHGVQLAAELDKAAEHRRAHFDDGEGPGGF